MPARDHKRAGRSLGSVLEELVKDLGIRPKLTEYEAVQQWNAVVGERIAQVTEADRIVKGTLTVKVTTGVWRNELMLRKEEIRQKLNEVLGAEIVKDIRFR